MSTLTCTPNGFLIATLVVKGGEADALRAAIYYNLHGWDTRRIEKLVDENYLVQLTVRS